MMKYFVIVLSMFVALGASSQNVKLNIKDFHSYNPSLRSSADSAILIAGIVLNSDTFRNELRKLNFDCRNHCDCKTYCEKCRREDFSGQVVVDSIVKYPNVFVTLYLNDCSNEYGHTYCLDDTIHSCHKVVYDEMELPFAYCYAYHIVHEYMHMRGFNHYDRRHRNDVAEQMGILAYHILKGWHLNHKPLI